MFFEGIASAQSAAAPAASGAQAPLIDQLLYGPGVPFSLLILASLLSSCADVPDAFDKALDTVCAVRVAQKAQAPTGK